MTQPPHITKTEAEAHASGPQDDDLTQRLGEVELALEILVDIEADYDWLRPNDFCRDAGTKDWCRDARMKEVKASLSRISDLCRDGKAYRAERQSKPRRPRRPSTVMLVKRAEKTGKTVILPS